MDILSFIGERLSSATSQKIEVDQSANVLYANRHEAKNSPTGPVNAAQAHR
jgi:hypothetical protein